MPWGDSGSAGGPVGRDRRAPGEAWSQLSGEVRVELTRPLRGESGSASPPGVDPSRRRLDCRDLRQEGPRLPELSEEPAEGEGEPRTIERPRMRARLADQGEPARPPGEGWRHDPMPPSSPGEAPPGLSAPSGPMGLKPTEGGRRGRLRRRDTKSDCRGSRATPGRRARDRTGPKICSDGWGARPPAPGNRRAARQKCTLGSRVCT